MKLQLNLLEREEDRLEVGLDPQAQGTSIPEWKYSNWEEDGYKDSNYNSMLGIGSNEMKRKWNFFFDPFPPFRIRVAVRFRQMNIMSAKHLSSTHFPQMISGTSNTYWIFIVIRSESFLKPGF